MSCFALLCLALCFVELQANAHLQHRIYWPWFSSNCLLIKYLFSLLKLSVCRSNKLTSVNLTFYVQYIRCSTILFFVHSFELIRNSSFAIFIISFSLMVGCCRIFDIAPSATSLRLFLHLIQVRFDRKIKHKHIHIFRGGFFPPLVSHESGNKAFRAKCFYCRAHYRINK